MPPKFKFTRDEIIFAAFELTKEQGITALTARALAEKLGSSSKVIFGLFENMDEVHREVAAAARKRYAEYINKGLNDNIPYNGVAMQYINFAINEPKIFQLLWMNEQQDVSEFSGILPLVDENYEKILAYAMETYHLDMERAKYLYQNVWIYAHGIAALCATRMCSFTEDEIRQMVTDACMGIIKSMGD